MSNELQGNRRSNSWVPRRRAGLGPEPGDRATLEGLPGVRTRLCRVAVAADVHRARFAWLQCPQRSGEARALGLAPGEPGRGTSRSRSMALELAEDSRPGCGDGPRAVDRAAHDD